MRALRRFSRAHRVNAPLTARDVLGVPLLPPGGVTAGTNRARAALRRIHDLLAPPPVRVLEALFGVLDHRVLVALCEIGVPDALTGPIDPAVLARRLGAEPTMLERLLRFGATRGWVRIDRRGRVSPTRVTAFLRRDHPGGWRAWVDFAGGDEVVAAVDALSARPGETDAFSAANGSTFFEWMAAHPDRWAIFDRAMAAGARMHALTLAAAIDWSDTATVCDVGGGTGTLLATLLDLEPHLQGTVFDLPDVANRAVVHPRLRAVPGDVFTAVPAGFDAYLLVNVLHDWSDDDAIRILRRVGDAAPRGALVIVVDGDRAVVPRDDLVVRTDLLMAALTTGGKERDVAAMADLARTADLRHVRALRLASGDLAHLLEHR